MSPATKNPEEPVLLQLDLEHKAGGVQDRAVLAGIEVAPAPLGLMIVQRALAAALAAPPADARFVFQVDVNFLLLSRELDALDLPGAFDAENPGIELAVSGKDPAGAEHAAERFQEKSLGRAHAPASQMFHRDLAQRVGTVAHVSQR